jgi:putative hydrolase of the HAD superfamily
LKHIRTLCFDLDDTLWDMQAVIPRAEQTLHSWFAEHFPRVAARYTPEQMQQLRIATVRNNRHLRHDLGELRRRMLRQILRECQYPESAAEAAFGIFYRARNEVTLFADVPPVLEQLARTHRLVALTNGNACLHTIGIARHFDAVITATDLGAAKPDPAFFAGAIARAGLEPATTLHIGDHPENDIQAAAAAGFGTVWVNRSAAVWELPACRPDRELDSLAELPELLRG